MSVVVRFILFPIVVKRDRPESFHFQNLSDKTTKTINRVGLCSAVSWLQTERGPEAV